MFNWKFWKWKKNMLKENLQVLEHLIIILENSIKELKTRFEKIEENKEELKIKIQKLFTNLRNILNEKEDKLLLEIDNKYNYLFSFGEKIREIEKLPNKSKKLLQKVKSHDYYFKNSKLNFVINDCISIENEIKKINLINVLNNKTKENNELFYNIKFSPGSEDVNKFIEVLKNYGNIKENYIKIFNSKIEFDEKLVKSWLDNRFFIAELLYRMTKWNKSKGFSR